MLQNFDKFCLVRLFLCLTDQQNVYPIMLNLLTVKAVRNSFWRNVNAVKSQVKNSKGRSMVKKTFLSRAGVKFFFEFLSDL